MTYRERRERRLRRRPAVRLPPKRRRRLALPPMQALLSLLLVMVLYYGAVMLKGVAPARAPVSGEAPLFQLCVIDVGQGSSALLLTKDKAVLVDGGDIGQGDAVMDKLDELGVRALDLVVASHPHSDHIGGLAELVGVVPVRQVLMPRVPDDMIPTTKTYQRFLDAIEGAGSTLTVCEQPISFALDKDVTLSVVGSFLQHPVSLNDCSLVLRVDAGAASFLLMGDAEVSTEDALRERGVDVDADILVAGHHGSATSSRQHFLNAVTPMASAVSVGIDNSYGLPSAQVLERLSRFGEIYRTDLNGDILFTTDGGIIQVTGGNLSRSLDARG